MKASNIVEYAPGIKKPNEAFPVSENVTYGVVEAGDSGKEAGKKIVIGCLKIRRGVRGIYPSNCGPVTPRLGT